MEVIFKNTASDETIIPFPISPNNDINIYTIPTIKNVGDISLDNSPIQIF